EQPEVRVAELLARHMAPVARRPVLREQPPAVLHRPPPEPPLLEYWRPPLPGPHWLVPVVPQLAERVLLLRLQVVLQQPRDHLASARAKPAGHSLRPTRPRPPRHPPAAF